MTTADLRSSMTRTLRSYWRDAAGYQKFAYAAAGLLLASGVGLRLVLVASGDTWSGEVSFRKPATFGLSFGLSLATLAWFLTFFPRNRWLAWIVTGVLVATMGFEVFAVTLQRWRGVPSHFNTATPFDATLFSLMGSAVAVIGLVIAALAVWSLLPMKASPGLAWAVRLGMLLLLAAQFFGAQIIANAFALAAEGGAGPFNIRGEAGVMKLPHFLAMHAVQVLPVLAWLLGFTRWPRARVVALVFVAAGGYTALLAASALQMYRGLAPLALAPLPGALAAAGLGALIGCGLVTLAALARAARPATA